MAKIDGASLVAPVLKALTSGSSHEKGKSLEECFSSILQLVPGIGDIRHRIVDFARSQEIDLTVWNNRVEGGLPFLPEMFLVECKNWTRAVDSREVGLFLLKLLMRKQRFGVLVAANGITGDEDDLMEANQMIAYGLSQEISVIVIRLADLQKLTNTDEFVRLIQDRLMDLTGSRGQFNRST